MSQERTEQRAVTLEELQREMKGKIGFGPNAERTRILIEGFRKYPESFKRWIDEGNYYGWDVDSFIQMIWSKDAEIDRLNATITGQAEAIREQTAKVQERDETIKDFANLSRENAKEIYVREKDIAKMRAALASAKDKFESIGRSDRKVQIELLALRGYEESGAALKGVE